MPEEGQSIPVRVEMFDWHKIDGEESRNSGVFDGLFFYKKEYVWQLSYQELCEGQTFFSTFISKKELITFSRQGFYSTELSLSQGRWCDGCSKTPVGELWFQVFLRKFFENIGNNGGNFSLDYIIAFPEMKTEHNMEVAVKRI